MFRSKTLKRRLQLITTAMITIIVALVTYGTLRGGPTNISPPVPRETTGSNPQRLRSELEVEIVTLHPKNFEPSEMIRPKGPFVLFIDDRSGRETSALVLHRLKGDKVREVKVDRRKSEWNGLLDLPSGDYVLQDTSNPELRCQITITP